MSTRGCRWLAATVVAGATAPRTVALRTRNRPTSSSVSSTNATVTGPRNAYRWLVDLALRGGAPDNITVVVGDVVEVDDLPDGAAPETTSHVVGAAAQDRNRPSRGGKGAAARAAEHSAATRARNASTTPPPPTSFAEDDIVPTRSVWRRVLLALVVVVVLAAVAVAGWLGYRWTQDQYYVAVDNGRIAVFRGIPQTVGPIALSEAVETSGTEVVDLPGYFQDRLAATIPANDLADARRRVADLEDQADGS